MPQRIPRTIDAFATYLITSNAYMLDGAPVKNWMRLGWTQAEMTQWTGFVTLWSPLYTKYSDKKGSRTTVITEQLHEIIGRCVNLDKTCRVLDRVAASPNVTIPDMETLHIKKGVLQDTTASRKKSGITENVVAALQALGGGDFSIKCRTSHDTKHASIAKDADSVQYIYLVGDTAPNSASDKGLTKEISTKASFILKTGTDNAKKDLFIFFRWYNTKHPELAGPWSALQTMVVL